MKPRAVLIGVLLGACPFALPAVAADDPTKKVLDDWSANRTRFKSVRYTLSGTFELKNPDLGPKQSGIRPFTHPLTATVLIDITNRRSRIESSSPRPTLADRNKWFSDYKVTTYDKKSMQVHLPREKNEHSEADLSLSTGDLRQMPGIDSLYWPILEAHGFVPNVYHRPHPHRFPEGHDPDEFEAQGTSQLNGRACLIIRTLPDKQSHDEFWVDPARGSCVVRHVLYSSKTNPFFRFDTDYQQIEGAWLPKKWAKTHSDNHRVVQIERFDVTRVDVNPDVGDGDFTIPITPGMIVKEYKYPDAGAGLDPARPSTKTSRAKESGGLEVIGETGFTTTEGKQLLPEREWRWWWIALATGLVVVAGGWVWRKRRGASAPPA